MMQVFTEIRHGNATLQVGTNDGQRIEVAIALDNGVWNYSTIYQLECLDDLADCLDMYRDWRNSDSESRIKR